MSNHYSHRGVDLLQVIRKHTITGDVMNLLGINLQFLEKYEEAIEAYQKAIELELQGLGKTYSEIEEWEEPREPYNFPSGRNISIAIYWANLSSYYQVISQWEKANTAADQAIKLDHYSSYTWTQKIQALIRLEDYEQAHQVATKAIELLKREFPEEDISNLLLLEVEALRGANRDAEAIEVLEEARKVYPNEGMFYALAYMILRDSSKTDEAQAILAQASDADIQGTIRISLATAYYRVLIQAGRMDEAWHQIEKLNSSLSSESSWVVNLLGDLVVFSLEDESEQLIIELEMIKQFAEHYPDNADLRRLLGEAYLNQESSDQALQQYQIALELDPSSKNQLEAKCNIAYIQLLDGKIKEAEKLYHEIIDDGINVENEDPQNEISAAIAYFIDGKIVPESYWSESAGYSDPVIFMEKPLILAHANLTTIALKNTDFETAFDHWLELPVDHRNRNSAYKLLSSIEMARGNVKIAVAILRKRQEVSDSSDD